MKATQDREIFLVDVSAVGRREARQSLLDSIQELGYRCNAFEGFWNYWTEKPKSVPKRLLVLGDLSNIVRRYKADDPHRWVASVRDNSPYFLALIRTKLDEHYAYFVDDLLRHSDMRVTVCRAVKKEIQACIVEAVSALQPHSLLDVRYSATTSQLWVQFGDGVSGFVDWKLLGLENQANSLLFETATIGDGGESIEIARRDGGLFEIDAESIKAILDEKLAASLTAQAKKSDRTVGEHIRSAREAAGLKQQELGEKTGIDQAIISKLERGSHQPRVDTLERIATGLGLSLSELLTGGK